jgi:DeoR/GlpR family transcriptional regulator of sugar metabolism
MIAHERKLYILTQLNQKGVISIKAIARELDISEATVRRDFEKLEQTGKLKRVQGGAQLAGTGNSDFEAAELTMRQKRTLNNSAKEMIARYAASFVNEGECVFIDGGTSLAPLIKLLADKNIKIITNNHLNIHELVNPAAEIFLAGGNYLPHFGMCVGPVAENILAQFNYDHAFIGCTGVDLTQQMTFTSEMATMNMKNIAISHAEKVHLLIDDSKLQVRAFCRFKPLPEFDSVICNVSDRTRQLGELPANFIMIDN